MKIGVDNNNSDSLAARKQFTKMLVNKERHLQYYCKCLSEKSQEKQKRRRGIPLRLFAGLLSDGQFRHLDSILSGAARAKETSRVNKVHGFDARHTTEFICRLTFHSSGHGLRRSRLRQETGTPCQFHPPRSDGKTT